MQCVVKAERSTESPFRDMRLQVVILEVIIDVVEPIEFLSIVQQFGANSLRSMYPVRFR